MGNKYAVWEISTQNFPKKLTFIIEAILMMSCRIAQTIGSSREKCEPYLVMMIIMLVLHCSEKVTKMFDQS